MWSEGRHLGEASENKAILSLHLAGPTYLWGGGRLLGLTAQIPFVRRMLG